MEVYDNPYDTDDARSMGILLSDTFKLPFKSHGSTVYFQSWYPSDDELNEYTHVVVTSDTPWDPHNLVMPGGDLDDTDMNDERFIQQVTRYIARGHNRHHVTAAI